MRRTLWMSAIAGLVVSSGCTLDAVSDCFEGNYQCFDLENKDGCELKKCVDEEWKHEDDCEYGWDHHNSCLPACSLGERDEVGPDEDGMTIIKECRNVGNDKYSYEEIARCAFGTDHHECINPCTICKNTAGEMVECGALYDEDNKVMYTCRSETGWQIDRSCQNDFTRNEDPVLALDDARFESFLNRDLADQKVSDHLVVGQCGACTDELSPAFCTKLNEMSVYHGCVNGQLVRNRNEAWCKNSAKLKCLDAYGQDIYVDEKTNRYYCGNCDRACGLSEFCDNGECKSRIECGADGYAHINLGSRWVNAYCIDNVDKFKAFAKAVNEGKSYGGDGEENDDNAYVFNWEDEIVLEDETWTPIGSKDKPFTGIVLGNGKKIIIQSDLEMTDQTMGLFGYIDNAHIEHLDIQYKNSDITVNQPDLLYWGGLAGSVKDSFIQHIGLDLPGVVINYSVDPVKEDSSVKRIQVGGLIGSANDSVLSDISVTSKVQVLKGKIPDGVGKVKPIAVGGVIGLAKGLDLTHVDLKVDVKGQNEKAEIDSGVGGVIGVSLDTKRITGIRQKPTSGQSIDEKPIKVYGYINVGGLVGDLHQDSGEAIISNAEYGDEGTLSLDVTGGVYNMGGAFGTVYTQDYRSRVQISGFKFDEINLYVLDEANLGLSTPIEMNSSSSKYRYVGGFAGEFWSPDLSDSINSDVNNKIFYVEDVHIEQLKFKTEKQSCNLNNAKRPCNFGFGGFAGLTKYTKYQNVSIQSIAFSDHSFRDYIGGFAGSASYSVLENIDVGSFKIPIVTAPVYRRGGGLLGYSKNNIIAKVKVHNFVLKTEAESSTFLGGLIGYSSSTSLSEISLSDIQIGGDSSLGGIIGYSLRDSYNKCTLNNVNLSGTEKIGGIAGSASYPTISDVKILAMQIRGVVSIGGVVGYAKGKVDVKNAYILSNFYAVSSLGGAVGLIDGELDQIDIESSLINTNIKIYHDNSTDHSQLVGGFFGNVRSIANIARINLKNVSTMMNIVKDPENTREDHEFGQMIGNYLSVHSRLNLFNVNALIHSYAHSEDVVLPMVARFQSSELEPAYSSYIYKSIQPNDSACYTDYDDYACGKNLTGCCQFNDLENSSIHALTSEHLNVGLCGCAEKLSQASSEDGNTLDLSLCIKPETENSCSAFNHVAENLCDVKDENDTPETEGEGDIKLECAEVRIWKDYLCNTEKFKENLGCLNSECDDFIEILCRGTHNCTEILLPFPDRVPAPEWCHVKN